MGVRNALYDSVQAKTAQIVSHPSNGIFGRIETQQLCQQHAPFAVMDNATGIELIRPKFFVVFLASIACATS